MRMFQKEDTPENFILLYLTKKIIYIEGGKSLSRQQIDKTSYIMSLITFSHHHDIFAKTRSRMTTEITLSRQNEAGSSILVPESKALYILTAETGSEDNNARLPEQIDDVLRHDE